MSDTTTPGRVVELDASPNVAVRLAKAPLATRRRAEGLPDVELVLGDVAVDRDHLAAYDRVCGFVVRDALPATFVHVLAFPLQVALMVDHPFPLALPKLVHLRNHITQRRVVTAAERVTLRVRAENLAAHPKGTTVDLVADATVDGEAVWHGVSTYLQRGASPHGPQADTPAAEGGEGASTSADTVGSDSQTDVHVPTEPTALWQVPRDIGRRYATVSGDHNPIHLNPLAAKLAGFPRTIAHGMWTKAHSLAAVEARLPGAYTVDVAFKRPLVVPATVGFHTRARGSVRALAVHDRRSGAPHLVGTVASHH